jgi:hypothetical protein
MKELTKQTILDNSDNPDEVVFQVVTTIYDAEVTISGIKSSYPFVISGFGDDRKTKLSPEEILDFCKEVLKLNNNAKVASKIAGILYDNGHEEFAISLFADKSAYTGDDFSLKCFDETKAELEYLNVTLMGEILNDWMYKHYGDNDDFHFIELPGEPVDWYDGDAVIYGPLTATSKNAETPNYILRAIFMFFREKENLGKTILDNPNCPLGVLYDVIRGRFICSKSLKKYVKELDNMYYLTGDYSFQIVFRDNDELKEAAAKSPAVKKLKSAGFGRYADPDTGEVIAKMQDGKLAAV